MVGIYSVDDYESLGTIFYALFVDRYIHNLAIDLLSWYIDIKTDRYMY